MTSTKKKRGTGSVGWASMPAAPIFERSLLLCGSTKRRRSSARGRPHRQAGHASIRQVHAVRARLSEPARHARAHRRLLRRQLHRASQEAELGPADAALRARDEQARRRQGPHRLALCDARRRTSECSTSAARVGTFLQRLRPCTAPRGRRCRLQGPVAQPVARRRRVPLRAVLRRALADRSRFDLVTMWHFLEHDYDPLRSLRTARRVLKPGGRLVIEVPRLDSRTFRWFGDRWPGLQAPQHTVLFDRDSLLRARPEGGARGGRLPALRRVPAYFYLFTGRPSAAEGARPQPRSRHLRLLPRAAAAHAAAAVRAPPEPRDADGGLPEGAES